MLDSFNLCVHLGQEVISTVGPISTSMTIVCVQNWGKESGCGAQGVKKIERSEGVTFFLTGRKLYQVVHIHSLDLTDADVVYKGFAYRY